MDSLELVLSADPSLQVIYGFLILLAVALLCCAGAFIGMSDIAPGLGVTAIGFILMIITIGDWKEYRSNVDRVTEEGACDDVISGIETGRIRYLEPDDTRIVRRRCGEMDFLTAANSPRARIGATYDFTSASGERN